MPQRLPPSPRSTSGYRDHPASAIRLLRFVKRVQELGFSLNEAAGLVHLAEGGLRVCESARTLATARMGEIERRLADLQRMRDSLAELVATCGGRYVWDPPTAVAFLSAASGDGPSAESCCDDLNFFTTSASAQGMVHNPTSSCAVTFWTPRPPSTSAGASSVHSWP